MKHLENSVVVAAYDFKVIDINSQVLISKKQRNEMIYHQGSTFKRIKQSYLCGFRNRDESIKQVYICSRERNGFRCLFITMKDGNGLLVGSHNMSLEHSVDLYRSSRYEFKCHVNKCLTSSKTESPFNIINSYIKEHDINEYSPCLNYISSCICKEKQRNIGHIPQSFCELDLDKMKESWTVI